MDYSRYIFSPRLFIETFLYIVNKKGKLIPFKFNNVQLAYYNYLIKKYWKPYIDSRGNKRYRFQGIREVILKARQFGISTLIRALYFHDSITNQGINSYVYCQDFEKSKEMMVKDKLFYKKLPPNLKPAISYDTKSVVTFPEMLSKIQAGKPGVGKYG